MNDPRIHITSENLVQSEAVPVLDEPMEAHAFVSRIPELLVAEMNA
jgi:hypothetical protein